MDLKNKKCIIYTRCSTEQQKQKGNSHEYQQRECEAFAERHEMNIIGTFSDTVTGTSYANREQLEIALTYCTNHKVHYVIVYKIDRYGRDTEGALHMMRRFKEIGTEVNFTDEWLNYQDPTWPIIFNIKIGLAQTESLKISERTKDGIYQNLLNGYYPYTAPPGYKKKVTGASYNGKDIKILVPDYKAKYILKCFEGIIIGYTKRFLYEEYGEKLGIKRNTFYELFKRKVYAGYVQVPAYKNNDALEVKGKHKAIITEDLFERVQIISSQQSKRRSGKIKNVNAGIQYYLKGSILCPKSGKKMTAGKSRSSTGKYYFYYATPSGKERCNLPVAKCHAIVNDALKELNLNDEQKLSLQKKLEAKSNAESSQLKKNIEKARVELSKLDSRMDRIMNDYMDGLLDAANFKEIKTNLEQSLNSYKNTIERDSLILEKIEGIAVKGPQVLNLIAKCFAELGEKKKAQMLKCLFPLGFVLDLEKEKVRTPHVNFMLNVINGKSVSYEKIKTGNSEISEFPAGGWKMGHDFEREMVLFRNLVDMILADAS